MVLLVSGWLSQCGYMTDPSPIPVRELAAPQAQARFKAGHLVLWWQRPVNTLLPSEFEELQLLNEESKVLEEQIGVNVNKLLGD